MSVSSDLRSYLLADSLIASLIVDRIYPMKSPQNSVMPAITYFWVSGSRSHSMDSANGLSMPRVQFDCWAKTYLSAEILFEALRKRLDGFKGTAGTSPGTTVQGVFFENENDAYEPEPELFRRSCDFMVNYEEGI